MKKLGTIVNQWMFPEKVTEEFGRVRKAVFSFAGRVSEQSIQTEEHLHCSNPPAGRAKVHQGLIDFVRFLSCFDNGGAKLDEMDEPESNDIPHLDGIGRDIFDTVRGEFRDRSVSDVEDV